MIELGGIPLRRLEYFVAAIESAHSVSSLSDFFMWVRGSLWAVFPHEIMLCSLGNPKESQYYRDCLHDEPLSAHKSAMLLDGPYSVLARLQAHARQFQVGELCLDAAGNCSLPLPEGLASDFAALGLGELWFVDCGSGGNLSPCSFALIGRTLRAELQPLLPLFKASIQLVLMRVTASGSDAQALAKPDASDTALTPRQQEIMNWVRQGKTNEEVGLIMGISPFTVKNHLQKIYARLKVSNRLQAVTSDRAFS